MIAYIFDDGSFTILGRKKTNIINTGGIKVQNRMGGGATAPAHRDSFTSRYRTQSTGEAVVLLLKHAGEHKYRYARARMDNSCQYHSPKYI